MPPTWPSEPQVVLEGRTIRLEPLEERHARDLHEAGREASIWTYMPRGPLASVDDARAMIRSVLESARDGSAWPFATVENESGRAIGSTRYFDIRPEHRGLEIGWTWLGVAWQRTAANTEQKRLLSPTPSTSSEPCACSSRPTRATSALSARSSGSAACGKACCART
jgi:RimJ/RimL family protein N-acetyltransferase